MVLRDLHRFSAKKFISRLEYDAAQTDRIILLLRKETFHRFSGRLAVMAAERRVCPVRRKENIARALNLAKQLQSRPQIFFGLWPAQRMVEICEPFRSPWLASSVPHVRETFEKFISNCRIA